MSWRSWHRPLSFIFIFRLKSFKTKRRRTETTRTSGITAYDTRLLEKEYFSFIIFGRVFGMFLVLYSSGIRGTYAYVVDESVPAKLQSSARTTPQRISLIKITVEMRPSRCRRQQTQPKQNFNGRTSDIHRFCENRHWIWQRKQERNTHTHAPSNAMKWHSD